MPQYSIESLKILDMFFTMMMHAEKNFHLGMFGGWTNMKFSTKKAEVAAPAGREAREAVRARANVAEGAFGMGNSFLFGMDFGYRFDIKNTGFFIDPTLRLAFRFKKSNVWAGNNTRTGERDHVKFTFMPIDLLLKAGYTMKQFSVYSMAGGGGTLMTNNAVVSQSEFKGNFTCGGGVNFKFTDTLSLFTEYSYTRIFIKDSDINHNAVVAGLQFNF